MTTEQRSKYLERLIAKKVELESKGRPMMSCERHADMMDEIDAVRERNAAVFLSEADALTLKAVLRSIERVHDGSYGECIACEKPIAGKRLEALAYAERCVTCQDEYEERLRQGDEDLSDEEAA